ncbi:MAG: DUF2007 domain-containing protein [Alphaproteobacteria bacterium]|nr:DUF2007 domain-containing protein [Pseudomonadota bacterium]MCZ6483374.1 DUF2007 domain-containing protein [Alphaproteobacteria bacterium]MCH7634602.1 DUF2007 domain-containing protein [Pseudomonadota bacterium]MCH8138000.1 DUF2007 domain-containing protein [Pseudomonadota bacterium]MCZ6743993.1 DUF2007 domain-containing protein [Alphaproteobacteria bacterium]
MKELLRTNDMVLISWVRALLAGDDIEAFVFDNHMSILEGSANAIPRRLMVVDEQYDRACRLLDAAEVHHRHG